MNHEFYTDRLSSYFDQELKNEEFVIVDEHVKQCVECQQLLAQYAKLDDTINRHAELDDTAYWEKSAQKIEAAIGGDQKTEVIAIPKSTYKGLWWKISGLAASIAILAFISLYEKDITNDLDQQISPAPVLKKAQPADSVVIVESPDQYRQNPAREESVPVIQNERDEPCTRWNNVGSDTHQGGSHEAGSAGPTHISWSRSKTKRPQTFKIGVGDQL